MNEATDSQGMSMRYPATRWQDALPTGSGVVGALVYGQITKETILVNHDGLFYPRARLEAFDVSDLLPEVRRLINEGQCQEAAGLMPDAHLRRTGSEAGHTNSGRDPYQPFCSIQLTMPTDGPFHGYRRGVDFATGRAWVAWSDDTATFTREVFVSRVTDTVFLRIRADKPGVVSCCVALNRAQNEQLAEVGHSDSKRDDIDLESSRGASLDNRTVSFSGRYPNGQSFAAEGQVVTVGGTLDEVDGQLEVKGADEVVLQVRLALSETCDAVEPVAFDAAFADHVALHTELFNRVTLKLGQDQPQTNEEMLMAAYDGDVPTRLTQTMFEFGRYLLICSSRPGGWPANLQGLWNGDYAPAWNSDVHTDENIQMNYWQAMPGGLADVALPLFDYFEKHLDDFRQNARNIFGCRGILIPIAMTTNGIDVPRVWSNWTAAAGWIAQHFYDYYLFTGDLEFLKDRVVPWLKETALFYEDFLFDGEDGKLVFNPSLSPENRPTGTNSLLSINATMDVAVCREVLSNLCDACDRLGIEAENVTGWRGMLAKLPDYEVNEDGAMREWLHPAFKDNYHHRHQSHVYPVFPGLEVTEESNPAIFDACRVAVEKRLVIGLTSQTGWSMAHMANIYARLGMGDRALECMEILSRSSTGPNLFTYHNDWRAMGLSLGGWFAHPPFQIDANFGITAAVLEMLVFSKPGLLKLLPALPAKWAEGTVTGINGRGGITVDMAWSTKSGSLNAVIMSRCDQQVLLRLPDWVGTVNADVAGAFERDEEHGDGHWRVSLCEGTPLSISTEGRD